MNLAIYSLFRDNTPQYIEAYLNRILLNTLPDVNFRLYLVEGDSLMDTFGFLVFMKQRFYQLDICLIKHDTGNIRQGSVITDIRMDTLSRTANAALDAIANDEWADKILLIESDLLFRSTMIEDLINTDKDVVAPTVWAGGAFYDIWGFRYLDGTLTTPAFNPTELTELSSVGSVALYPAKPIYDGLRFDKECMVGLCKNLKKRGYSIWTNPNVKVNHPL